MKRNDYLLALTSGFLSVPEEKINEAVTFVNPDIELTAPAKPGAISLGGRYDENKRSGFVEWIKYLREEKIQGIKIFYISDDIAILPSHIASAFAGGEEFVLEITTLKKRRSFTLQTILSAAFQITPSQFAELIDRQNYKEKLWLRITELVEEFVQLNSISGFDKNDAKGFIGSKEGMPVFEFLAAQLFQEIQIECQIHEMAFEIPEKLAAFFYKSDFPFGEAEKDSVFLYPVKEVNPAELLMLINAQPFTKEIWEACEKEFAENPHEEIPSLKGAEWSVYLKKLSPSSLKEFCSIICGIIAGICEENEIKPIIPAELSNTFGPDEIEEKRAQARGRTADHWLLQKNKDSWELYFFELFSEDIRLEEPISLQEATKHFSSALLRAAAFAGKIDSPFSEAFLLGSYFLNNEFTAGDFDPDHFKGISKELKKKGFSERARENAADLIYYGENMKKLHWPFSKISGLFAVSISDVFGGMGSWNDIYLEDENENESYQSISGELFTSQRNYFAALLSYKKNHYEKN
jgi:hypothetical protein